MYEILIYALAYALAKCTVLFCIPWNPTENGTRNKNAWIPNKRFSEREGRGKKTKDAIKERKLNQFPK